MNPKFEGYAGGRLEVFKHGVEYNIEEIRFFTKKREAFDKFRELWDFEHVTLKTLDNIRKIVQLEFQDNLEV